jgi:hypothetical protein
MGLKALIFLILSTTALAHNSSQPSAPPGPKSVTVPMGLDHNRVIIDVDIPLPDGSTQRIRGWVDNGNPDLYISRRAAMLMGLTITCTDKACSAPPPNEITIGGMKISLASVKAATIPLKPVAAAAVMAPGMNAEINLPSRVLRNYDVLVDFPDRQFNIGQPGTLRFKGVNAKVMVNAENGLIQIASRIENKKYNLALDVGASISLLGDEAFKTLAAAHPDWPQMTGAIGPANMWGSDDERSSKLLRVRRVQYGPLFLTNVAVASLGTDGTAYFEKRAGIATAGLLGANALTNYRVGLDYAHSTVYFDIGRLFNFPDFDVIGVILRSEDDGRFTILGIADYDGKPSVPEGPDGVQAGDHLIAVDGIPVLGSTLGQVWLTLGGSPGKERKLTVERGGRQWTVVATVQHFLGEPEESEAKKVGSKK